MNIIWIYLWNSKEKKKNIDIRVNVKEKERFVDNNEKMGEHCVCVSAYELDAWMRLRMTK